MIRPLRSRTAEQQDEYDDELTDWLEANNMTYEEWVALGKATEHDVD